MAAGVNSFVSETLSLVRDCLADGKLDASEILRIGVFVAQKVNALKALSGSEKKTLVLEVVKKAVEAAVPVEQREQVGYTAAVQVLPTVLDIAVSAAHGKLALQRVRAGISVNCLWGFLSGFWPRHTGSAAVTAVLGHVPVVVPSVAVSPVKKETPESASPPLSVPEGTMDASPLKESSKEPSPEIQAEAPPLESRLPEVAGIELPNSAIPLPQILEETSSE